MLNEEKFDSVSCVCQACGTSIRHRKGFPCFRELCPVCHSTMVRKEAGLDPLSLDLNPDKILPFVDKERCIACGLCLEVCPVNAIHFRKGKAWIDSQACTGCGICPGQCPHYAITATRSENP